MLIWLHFAARCTSMGMQKGMETQQICADCSIRMFVRHMSRKKASSAGTSNCSMRRSLASASGLHRDILAAASSLSVAARERACDVRSIECWAESKGCSSGCSPEAAAALLGAAA